MTGKTHILGGILLAEVVVFALNNMGYGNSNSGAGALLFIAGSAVGSLLPDIDEPESTISRKLPLIADLFAWNRDEKRARAYYYWGDDETKARLQNEARDASHRGITHYLITWLVMSLVVLGLGFIFKRAGILRMLLYGLIPGVLSHILLDLISGRIPILAPFCRKSIGVRLVRVGGLLEGTIIRLLFLVLIVLVAVCSSR